METVVLVIHLILVATMIAIVLLQRSEGGALGIGGGGNFMAARGTGNVLTRVTTILAAAFFVTSIVLTAIARSNSDDGGIFDNLPANQLIEGVDRPAGGGVLDLLGGAPDDPVAVPNDAGGAVEPGAAPVDGDGAGVPDVVPNDAGGVAPAAMPNDAGAPILVPNDPGGAPP